MAITFQHTSSWKCIFDLKGKNTQNEMYNRGPARVGALAVPGRFSDTQAERVADLLNTKGIPMQSFAVPRFQRNYAWKDGVDALWTDVYDNYVEQGDKTANNPFAAQYMLGPMVLLKKGDGPRCFEWYVIDGQQRLATLTTLFCVMRDLYIQLDAKVDSTQMLKRLEELIMRKSSGKEAEPKLTLNYADEDFFRNNIQKPGNPKAKFSTWEKMKENKTSISDSQKLLIDCYKYFYDKVTKSLITGFPAQEEFDDKLKEYNDGIRKSAIREIVKDPEAYSLPKSFFDRHWNRNGFKNRGITNDDYNEYKKAKSKSLGKKFETVDAYVDHRVNQNNKKLDRKIKNFNSDDKWAKLEEKCADNILQLENFFDHIVTEVFVVSVKVESEDDASIIFERLNTRGKRLTNPELIKNTCFDVIGNKNEIVAWDGRWTTMFNELKNPDKFVRESFRSRYFENQEDPTTKKMIRPSTANLFKILKPIITNNVQTYLEGLEADAKFVKVLDSGMYYDDEEISSWFAAITLLNPVHIRIPLITAHREWVYGKQFKDVLRMLVLFHFRNKTIARKHTSTVESIMIKVAEKIKKGSGADEIRAYLEEEDVDDEEFEELFYRSQIDDSNIIKYILIELEKYIRGGSQNQLEIKINGTVEHILPKDQSEWDRNKFFGGWGGDCTRIAFRSFVNRIGNMTLLTKSINSEIQKEEFAAKKKKAYSKEEVLQLTIKTVNDGLYCSKELGKSLPELDKSTGWTAKTIDSRSKCFAKIAKVIWNI